MAQPGNTPAAVWAGMRESAERACTSHPDQVHIRRFRIAGLPIAITFAGAEFARQFTRSLSHLLVQDFAPGEKPLAMLLWDEAATATPLPQVEFAEAFPETAQYDDRVLARSADDRYRIQENLHLYTILDLQGGEVLGWIRSIEELSTYEIGKPLLPILFAWYSWNDVHPMHAAAVARGQDGVLIGGAGGSGKSTTSLTCMLAGFSFLGDDYTGLPAPDEGGEQTVFSFFASLWLEDSHSARFNNILQHRIEGMTPPAIKLPFAIGDAHPERMVPACTVRAVILPRVAHLPVSRLSRATPAEALLKMAPSSVLQLPFINSVGSLHRTAQLLRRVPSFWLDLGTDLASIPGCVDEALRLAKKAAPET